MALGLTRHAQRGAPVGEDRAYGLRQRLGVATSEQGTQTSLLQDVARTVDVGRNDRHACRHGFDDDQPKGFIARRHDEQVEATHKSMRIGHPADEFDMVLQAQFRCQRRQGPALGPISGDAQDEIPASVAQSGRRTDQNVERFHLMQTAHSADNRTLSRAAFDCLGFEMSEVGDFEPADLRIGLAQSLDDIAADTQGGARALEVRLVALIMQDLDGADFTGNERHQAQARGAIAVRENDVGFEATHDQGQLQRGQRIVVTQGVQRQKVGFARALAQLLRHHARRVPHAQRGVAFGLESFVVADRHGLNTALALGKHDIQYARLHCAHP